MKEILVVGAKGQLGQCIQKLSSDYKSLSFLFLDSTALDVTKPEDIEAVFKKNQFDYCINCSAYTNVDKAEEEFELAKNINTLGAKFLAKSCNENKTILIHISTDFVFDGNNNLPYKEDDLTNPLGVYGATKLSGEKEISAVLKEHYIIRTSWLYSSFGNNFVKTMLRLANEKDELNIINDQKGTPTNAHDLAAAIIEIIDSKVSKYGIYHYSNTGSTTWFEFAKAVFEMTNTKIKINPVNSDQYVTKAKRPKYSVLDKTKICSTFKINISDWKESLGKSINTIKR